MSAQGAPISTTMPSRMAAILEAGDKKRVLKGRLRQASMFRVLSDAELNEAVEVARCQTYRRGELVRDDEGTVRDFYIVLTGAVRCSLLSTDGNQVTLGTVQPGMVFWLEPTDTQGIATFCGEVLVDNTELCCIPYSYVRRLMARNPGFAMEIYDVLYVWCARFRDRLAELSHEHVGTRLAHLLSRLAATADRHVIMETHDELALWIGTSRARVTKELRRLRERGLIDYQPHVRGIMVPDPERLGTLRG